MHPYHLLLHSKNDSNLKEKITLSKVVKSQSLCLLLCIFNVFSCRLETKFLIYVYAQACLT